jgi:DNA-binding NarL/FixJ family response regulator
VHRERARRAEDEQAQRVAAARAHERTLIAREMHDVLAHRLSLVAASAGALEYRPDSSPEQLANRALSPREHEVAIEVARGCSSAEIAEGLGMTLATVKAHVSHVLTKLNLGNRTQIALLVHDAGLV